MSDKQIDTVPLMRNLAFSLGISSSLTVREYFQESRNLSDIADSIAGFSISYLRLINESRASIILSSTISLSSFYDLGDKCLSECSIVDIRTIFGSLVFDRIQRRLSHESRNEYTKFCISSLVHDDAMLSVIRSAEAFEFCHRAFILVLSSILRDGQKSIEASKAFLNEISLAPRFTLS